MSRTVLKLFGVLLLVVSAAALLARADGARASDSGSAVAPLLSCPNVDGSDDNRVLVADLLRVLDAYFKDWPAEDYYLIYDLEGPYNPETGAGGLQRIDDVLSVLHSYFDVCPAVDTQVAKATQWAIENVPVFEDADALRELGYYNGSTDVPGQGRHYVNLMNWDGTFDPAAPEGLVYQNGRIAAQLYVVDGNAIGWGAHEASGWPPPPVPHEVDLEGDADGPRCSPTCSWDGTYDGWHLHYFLCTISIGTPGAAAIPGIFANIQSQEECAGLTGQPECTIPITVTPCYRFAETVGWMGHLWNWLPNTNQIPDEGGTNGRFADCFPDDEGWKAFNCPA